jgi:hypothetical protein
VPADNATGISSGPSLSVAATDPEGANLTVTWYGRSLAPVTPGPDFTLIGQPDTQYYTGQVNNGTNAMLKTINNWIVTNRVSRNIQYVATLGDCVEHGDAGDGVTPNIEWMRADTSYKIIEDPEATELPDGIPYGVTVGNHDQSPNGDANGTTTFYNQYFGEARFSGRPYYRGHYGTNNDNWYNFFSAGGMDFIVISFEYDTTPDQPILDWADQLLTTYADRRAIVLSHWICNTGNPASFGTQGQTIYNALRGHSNLFLMLCGHVPGEGRRQDTFNGVTINTLMSDYQGRTNGGNGWIRIMTFSPANGTIQVETYSPVLQQFETDADSRFTLTYDMTTPAFQMLGTSSGVSSGTNADFVWSGLTPNTPYEWYATVSGRQCHDERAEVEVHHVGDGRGRNSAARADRARRPSFPIQPRPRSSELRAALGRPRSAQPDRRAGSRGGGAGAGNVRSRTPSGGVRTAARPRAASPRDSTSCDSRRREAWPCRRWCGHAERGGARRTPLEVLVVGPPPPSA